MAKKEQFTAEAGLQQLTGYIEEIKDLLSADLWGNIFLNCSKNEVLIFWLLYRKREVNMSEIAEYIHVPLNTATGIVGRMEKSGLIERTRSEQDKRIVLIRFSDKGMAQFKRLISELMSYGMEVLGSLTSDELKLLESMMTKVKDVLKQQKKKENTAKKVRRITIE
ncbi:MAG: MarR family transcriptional regulator [Lachnospiraceae bacterium]|nr:MarR family transcriptional regulator [Lachnospiraceae bacterium]